MLCMVYQVYQVYQVYYIRITRYTTITVVWYTGDTHYTYSMVQTLQCIHTSMPYQNYLVYKYIQYTQYCRLYSKLQCTIPEFSSSIELLQYGIQWYGIRNGIQNIIINHTSITWNTNIKVPGYGAQYTQWYSIPSIPYSILLYTWYTIYKITVTLSIPLCIPCIPQYTWDTHWYGIRITWYTNITDGIVYGLLLIFSYDYEKHNVVRIYITVYLVQSQRSI